MLSTSAFHELLGYVSGIKKADWPTFILVKSVSLILASNQDFCSSEDCIYPVIPIPILLFL